MNSSFGLCLCPYFYSFPWFVSPLFLSVSLPLQISLSFSPSLSLSLCPLSFSIPLSSSLPTPLCLYIYIYTYIYMCGWYLQEDCGNFGFRINPRKRSAKWSSQIWNAIFTRNFAGTNCKYCKHKHVVCLWHCKTNCFRCLTLKKPPKLPHRPWRSHTHTHTHTHTHIYIYMHACNLIWWAVLGFQDVMKQQEIRRNQGKKQKHWEWKKPKIQQKPPRFCGGVCWPFFTGKLGIFKDFRPFFAHQSRLQPYIYIYISCCRVLNWTLFSFPIFKKLAKM